MISSIFPFLILKLFLVFFIEFPNQSHHFTKYSPKNVRKASSLKPLHLSIRTHELKINYNKNALPVS